MYAFSIIDCPAEPNLLPIFLKMNKILAKRPSYACMETVVSHVRVAWGGRKTTTMMMIPHCLTTRLSLSTCLSSYRSLLVSLAARACACVCVSSCLSFSRFLLFNMFTINTTHFYYSYLIETVPSQIKVLFFIFVS